MPQRILVIPEYNEARTIIDVLSHSEPFVDRIIVVNDGSRDHSAALVADWARDRPHVALLNLEVNQGASGALLVGFAYSFMLLQQGLITPDDLIVSIDADGQHRPDEIPAACEALAAKHLDVVLGRRTLEGYPLYKIIGNWGLSLWASLLTGYRYYDVECGFRVMRAAVLEHLLTFFLGRRYSCCQEIGIITALTGCKVENRFPAGIQYYRPGARFRDGITNLVMGLRAALRVWFRQRFDPVERAREILSQVHRDLPPHMQQEVS